MLCGMYPRALWVNKELYHYSEEGKKSRLMFLKKKKSAVGSNVQGFFSNKILCILEVKTIRSQKNWTLQHFYKHDEDAARKKRSG